MRIAIIGAGLAGLTAARALREGGCSPTVFDKSRGLGGRLATRRSDHGAFNHGAPEVTGADPRFAGYLASAGTAERTATGWQGRPGASALVRPLAEGLDLRLGAAVSAVTRAGGAYEIGLATGDVHRADRVICAIPAAQAARLLPDAPLDGVRMAPCWTLMAAFDGAVATAAPGDDMLSAIVAQPGAPGRWVAHADADWSRRHLEDEAPRVLKTLCDALCRRLGRDRPVAAMVHRWRFARTEVPLGQPFLALEAGQVLVGGDWALGGDAEHAFASGAAMARAVLDQA